MSTAESNKPRGEPRSVGETDSNRPTSLQRNGGPDRGQPLIIEAHAHRLVCPTCGLERHLPDGWQDMLGTTRLVCTKDNVEMVAA